MCVYLYSNTFNFQFSSVLDFPCGSAGKESTYSAGDLGSIPGLGRSPGERKGYPLQYSGLEIYMGYVHGVENSRTRLNNFHFQFSLSVVSDSLSPHGLQHARLPCPSPTPGAYSNIASVMPSNYLILCHTLLLLPSIFPSIRVFSNESSLHIRWPKYWSFSLASVLPMNILD